MPLLVACHFPAPGEQETLWRYRQLLGFHHEHASPDQLIETSETAHDAGNYAIASGFVGVLIGAVLMLANIDDPAAGGPGLAIAILTVLYGVFLKYFIFTPISRGLDQRAEKIYLQQSAEEAAK